MLSPCPSSHWCDEPEGEFESRWKDGCRLWRSHGCYASPAPGRDALSVQCPMGTQVPNPANCAAECSASCPVVLVQDPVGPSG